MGKTETIKQRAIWVYAPTLEQRKQWDKIAKENGMSLSKWIVQTIEDSLLEFDDEVKSIKDIETENKDLRKEISEIQSKLRRETIIRNNLEKEIRKYRAESFLSPSSEGIRQYDKELITLLRNTKSREGKRRYIDNDEILSRLGIEFTETEAVKAISSQLSRLERYGLAESSTKGWRWKEYD
ncbi:hypothetical protein AYK25_10185 [Thermoplasmatales archaeon SM1-50]|nr:MAG: hypothetical protein AYK25_10185 [Thermoplasmatales archaeon SM1-50]